MSRAEDFIKKQSHIIEDPTTVWISSYNARRAIEIARDEIYEWLKDNIHIYNGECEGDRKAIIEDLKQAMKDE